MSNIIKICKKHGELKKEDIYFYKTRINNIYPRCKICMKVITEKLRKNGYYKKWNKTEKGILSKKKNHDKVKDTSEFKEKRKKYYIKTRDWNRKNKNNPIYKIKKRESSKKYCKILGDYYIRKLLIRHNNLKSKDIPIGLVNLKKEMVRIKREIRKINGN